MGARSFLAAILLGTCIGITGFAPAPAWAQTAGQAAANTRIGIIDMGRVLQESDALLALRDAISESNESFQKAIEDEEAELQRANRDLNAVKDSLSEEEFRKRLADFERRVVGVQQNIQLQKNTFDRGYAEAYGRVEQELLQIVSDIAHERGYSVVIERKNAVLFDRSFDFSDEALVRLNERTKNLRISVGPGGSEAEPSASRNNSGGSEAEPSASRNNSSGDANDGGETETGAGSDGDGG